MPLSSSNIRGQPVACRCVCSGSVCHAFSGCAGAAPHLFFCYTFFSTGHFLDVTRFAMLRSKVLSLFFFPVFLTTVSIQYGKYRFVFFSLSRQRLSFRLLRMTISPPLLFLVCSRRSLPNAVVFSSPFKNSNFVCPTRVR